MKNEIDEKKLAEAKEKLACKIEPTTFTDGGISSAASAGSDHGAGKTAAAQDDFIGENGEVYLTRMTSAGG